MSDIKILLLGEFGIGKTSFINQITGTSFICNNDIRRCTVENQIGVYSRKSDKYDINFIDTPGFESDNEDSIIDNLKNIILTLDKKINYICVCIKTGRISPIYYQLFLILLQLLNEKCYNRFLFLFTYCENEWLSDKSMESWIYKNKEGNNFENKLFFKMLDVTNYNFNDITDDTNIRNKIEIEINNTTILKYNDVEMNENDKTIFITNQQIIKELISNKLKDNKKNK